MPAQVNGKIGDGQQYNRTATRWDYIAMNDLNTLRFSGDFTQDHRLTPVKVYTDIFRRSADEPGDSRRQYPDDS